MCTRLASMLHDPLIVAEIGIPFYRAYFSISDLLWNRVQNSAFYGAKIFIF